MDGKAGPPTRARVCPRPFPAFRLCSEFYLRDNVHIRKASVRELHIHTSELVREAEQGAAIPIEGRGHPAAELRPATAPARMPRTQKALIFDSMRDIWARMPQVPDSAQIIEEDRDR